MKYFIALLLLISCERDHGKPTKPTQAKKYKLLLFSAGYCGPCKEELRELQRWHDTYPNRERVTPIVYFIAGVPASKPATQEDADTFKSSLGLSFQIRADKYAKHYRTFYTSGTTVPATIITTEENKVVRIFNPGKITPEQIEAYL